MPLTNPRRILLLTPARSRPRPTLRQLKQQVALIAALLVVAAIVGGW